MPDDKWEGKLVPKLFKILGGTKTKTKIVMASNLLWRLFKDMKNTRAKEGECPYLEPDTENVKLCTLMAVMKEEYNWEYQLDRDFNFEGGFAGRIRVLREERMKVWPLYATGKTYRMLELNRRRMLTLPFSTRRTRTSSS